MDKRVTPPKRITSPGPNFHHFHFVTWGPPPPCKQALKKLLDPFLKQTGACQVGKNTN